MPAPERGAGPRPREGCDHGPASVGTGRILAGVQVHPRNGGMQPKKCKHGNLCQRSKPRVSWEVAGEQGNVFEMYKQPIQALS